MGNYRKIALYVILAVLGFFLWQAWQHDYPQKSQSQTKEMGPSNSTNQAAHFAPPTYKNDEDHRAVSPLPNGRQRVMATAANDHQVITVKTDVLDATIAVKGANLIATELPKYPVSLQQKDTPIKIFTPNKDNLYVSQTGITNTDYGKLHFTANQKNYELQAGQKQLNVTLTTKTRNGLLIEKTFTFKRNNYAITLNTKIKNESDKKWFGSFYYQLVRRYVPKSKLFHSRAYSGAAISSPGTPYEKKSFKNLSEENINQNIQGGWLAMQQHYFLSAWVPPQPTTNHFYSQMFGQGEEGKNNIFTVGFETPQITLAPGASNDHQATLYVGPELEKQLQAVAPHLDLTIDYGWLWWLSKILFVAMEWIHHVVGNWGWTIVLVTVLIKLIFYPLSAKSYTSMAKMREVQPRMKALKERYGDDRQALSKATMEFYKKEKINPIGGCLPMIIQIPVFFALYYVLIESVQLRQASFIFWIHDLSVKDPYYILPILMGLSMLLQQKLSPPPPDPMQAKMMMFLPVVFTVFFITFPAGLVLYWLVNNCVSVLQQWWVMKRFDPNAPIKRKGKKINSSR